MYACLWKPLVSVGILAEAFDRQITYAQPWFIIKVDGTNVSAWQGDLQIHPVALLYTSVVSSE